MSDVCDGCGKEEAGISWFAEAFRRLRAKKDQPDPGNLCGGCAGSLSGREIADRLINGVVAESQFIGLIGALGKT
ncbi:hypothetical protein [Bradyrhizobium sp. SZCCHNR3118]|uniref:hypothetical protein n=1 Tax=Bradyrhizobium sp. SZCCHNR3118 TaxID=3057468 RepID=UPI002916123C|nr:hypothetical protein [Bradyrhizobium sp. SZCCHNR3118]